MSQNEIQPSASHRFSLRSILLLLLLVGVGAGATAYAIGSAFAASNVLLRREQLNRTQPPQAPLELVTIAPLRQDSNLLA